MIFQKPLIYYSLMFLIPFIGIIAVTPVILKAAVFFKILDKPGDNKIHTSAKPLLGGLGIFLCFSVTILLFLPVEEKLLALIIAALILIATGLVDDIYNLKPLMKLAGQTAAAAVVVLWDISLYRVLLDYFDRFLFPDPVVLGLIIGWIVLMINAFNLIDGLDGLAAGTAALIFFAMAAISMITGANPNILGVQLIGLGACLGFLIYNFNPAKIFMGDTGSMLLGFILATTHLYTIKYPFSAQLVLGSIFIFAYPALDIAYTIYRRLRNKDSIFKGDKGHIHHILLSVGFSVRKTVLFIYLGNVVFASIAVVLLVLDIPARILLVIGIITIILVIFLFKKLLMASKQNDTYYLQR